MIMFQQIMISKRDLKKNFFFHQSQIVEKDFSFLKINLRERQVKSIFVNLIKQNKTRVWLNKSTSLQTLQYIVFTHASLSYYKKNTRSKGCGAISLKRRKSRLTQHNDTNPIEYRTEIWAIKRLFTSQQISVPKDTSLLKSFKVRLANLIIKDTLKAGNICCF